jgi:hypothetical protein
MQSRGAAAPRVKAPDRCAARRGDQAVRIEDQLRIAHGVERDARNDGRGGGELWKRPPHDVCGTQNPVGGEGGDPAPRAHDDRRERRQLPRRGRR